MHYYNVTVFGWGLNPEPSKYVHTRIDALIFSGCICTCGQAVIGSGVNFQLLCHSNAWSERPEEKRPTKDFVDFDKEPNKVSRTATDNNSQ